jgi:hypothetical protein
MLVDLDELYCIKGYEQAVAETDPEIASGDYTILNLLISKAADAEISL